MYPKRVGIPRAYIHIKMYGLLARHKTYVLLNGGSYTIGVQEWRERYLQSAESNFE